MNKGAKKKYLKVKFVGDEDIVSRIVHIDNINENEHLQPPSTPKRKKGEKPQTPFKTQPSNSPSTAARRNNGGIPTTPKRNLIAKDAQTPRRVRQQVRNQVAKRLEESHLATLEDTDEEEEDEAQSGDEENIEPKPKIATPSSKTVQVVTAPNGSSYFYLHSGGRKRQTSNHTLAQLGRDMDELMALPRLLADLPPAKHQGALDLQAKYQKNYFPHWLQLLREGFNVLLYGFGSKLNLMENFCSKYLEDYDHLLIHGFFPGLTIKHVLNSITLEVLEQNKTYTSAADQLDHILQHYQSVESEEEDLYLAIANVDGPNLRSDKAQSILCQLAASPHIHLMASIDHINAPLMWDQVKLGRLRWVWSNVTDPTSRYLSETSYEDSQQATTGSRLALSSLTHVFSSLPANTQKIFLILVRHQIEHLSHHRSTMAAAYLGMAFQDLVEESKEAFLVNSQLTIRAHLAEFKDHRVIVIRKGPDGTEYLYIPLDTAILEEFVEQVSVD